MKAHKNIAYTLIPNPGLEEKNPHKENYWVKWQNWNSSDRLDKGIIPMLNFLKLITVL